MSACKGLEWMADEGFILVGQHMVGADTYTGYHLDAWKIGKDGGMSRDRKKGYFIPNFCPACGSPFGIGEHRAEPNCKESAASAAQKEGAG